MAAFEYKAIDAKGQHKKGVLEGDNTRQIRQQLREQGLLPLDVTEVITTGIKKDLTLFQRRKRLSIADLALFTRQLAILLGASMPLEEALFAVAEQAEKDHIKSIILAVRSAVLEGQSLAFGLGNFPQAFSSLYCSTVAAGEHSGRLDAVLLRLADHVEQQHQLRLKIQQALIYPSLMTGISLAIVTFLLIYVVPKMIAIFNTTGQSLPLMTVILIAISQHLASYGLFTIVLLSITIFAFKRFLRHAAARNTWHRCLLKVPLLGYGIRIINTSRFARTLGILSSAGVSLLEAFTISAEMISNLPMRAAVQVAAQRIQEGASIHYALKQTGYFSPMSLHLIASGEASGALEDMLERAASHEEQQVSRMIDTSLRLFEPLLILIMGAVVLFIVLAILLPIFSLDQFAG